MFCSPFGFLGPSSTPNLGATSILEGGFVHSTFATCLILCRQDDWRLRYAYASSLQ
jgi:hypothetical protein